MTVAARAVAALGDADGASKIDTIERMAACAAGRVCLLDFGVIKAKLGGRWDAKRTDVCDLIGRFVQRTAGPAAIYTVVNDGSFVVCFPDGVGANAAGLGYRIMEDVLTHFLGACDHADVKISSVISLADGQIVSRPVTVQDALAAQLQAAPSSLAKPKVTAEPILVEDAAGRVPVLYGLETVVAVKHSKPIGFRLSTSFFDEHQIRFLTLRERTILPTASLLAIDLRTLLEARESGLIQDDHPCVIVPLSIQSFSNSRARTAVFDFLNRLRAEERSRLFVELIGIEDGTPTSRIAETVALLKPFCRAAVCQAPAGRIGLNNIRAARLSAVSIAARDIGSEGSKLAAGLLSFGESAKGIAPMLLATGLMSEALFDVCAVAGFTHVTTKA